MQVSYPEINLNCKAFSEIFFLKKNYHWLFLSQKRKSRFFGWFIFWQNQVFRIIDDLIFEQEIISAEIWGPETLILHFKDGKVRINLGDDFLEIKFSKASNFKLFFDIKEIFKNEAENRQINFKNASEKSVLLEEIISSSNIKIEILIEADGELKTDKRWLQKEMDYDRQRNSPPYEWIVCDGLSGNISSIRLKILSPQLNGGKKELFLLQDDSLTNFLLKQISAFYLHNYFAAGFPWFWENWYRDELLSLYFFKDYCHQDLLQEKLNFYLENLEKIWSANKNNQPSIAADTLLLLIANLERTDLISNFEKLKKYLKEWEATFIKDNEFNLPPQSTWMDTLNRQNAFEIESLYLLTLQKFSNIDSTYKNYFEMNKEKIKIKWQNSVDINFILGYTFFPSLYEKNFWNETFKNLLRTHYLSWGGLSSLSKKHPDFKSEDDGELATAYHRGNSWYFLNNIAAAVLADIDFKYYRQFIEKIVEASLSDIFTDGALGFSSEISSANQRKSEGCLVQLWSLSSLLFLTKSKEIKPIIQKMVENLLSKK